MSDSRDIIQSRLLANIDNKYNKSQGEFFYDAEKPVSIELENAYGKIDGMLDKRFADTATGKDLDRITNAVGIYRKLTTKSTTTVTITGIAGSSIVKGEKVASDSVSFVFKEDKIVPDSKTVDVLVECEKYGTIGNMPVGAIKYFPKTLAGLQTVINKEGVTNGYNEENDEALRKRYYAKIQTPATSGNKYHYEQWALEVTGVGSAKCIPVPGNVTVVIVDSNNKGASQELIQAVHSHIDDERPVLAGTLNVVSATEKVINVTVNVKLAAGYNLGTVQAQFKQSVDNYLKSIKFETKSNGIYVSINKISNLLYTLEGVSDFDSLLVNGAYSNVAIADTEIAVIGDVTFGIMK